MEIHAVEKNKTEEGDKQRWDQDEWLAVLNRVLRKEQREKAS